jgi:hypothetical protein
VDGLVLALLMCHYLQETAANIRNNTMSPALKLFRDYVKESPECENASSNPWRGRFKITIRCDNIEEFGLPSFITSYNAKPVLIRNTGTMYRYVFTSCSLAWLLACLLASIFAKNLVILFKFSW